MTRKTSTLECLPTLIHYIVMGVCPGKVWLTHFCLQQWKALNIHSQTIIRNGRCTSYDYKRLGSQSQKLSAEPVNKWLVSFILGVIAIL